MHFIKVKRCSNFSRPHSCSRMLTRSLEPSRVTLAHVPFNQWPVSAQHQPRRQHRKVIMRTFCGRTLKETKDLPPKAVAAKLLHLSIQSMVRITSAPMLGLSANLTRKVLQQCRILWVVPKKATDPTCACAQRKKNLLKH